jgi:hypothetical protein
MGMSYPSKMARNVDSTSTIIHRRALIEGRHRRSAVYCSRLLNSSWSPEASRTKTSRHEASQLWSRHHGHKSLDHNRVRPCDLPRRGNELISSTCQILAQRYIIHSRDLDFTLNVFARPRGCNTTPGTAFPPFRFNRHDRTYRTLFSQRRFIL